MARYIMKTHLCLHGLEISTHLCDLWFACIGESDFPSILLSFAGPPDAGPGLNIPLQSFCSPRLSESEVSFSTLLASV